MLLTEDAYITSSEELNANNTIVEIFPNPTKNKFYLKYISSEASVSEINISIYTNTGIEVKSQNIQLTKNNIYEIDCANLTTGNYTLIVKSENETITKKLTILK